MCVFAIAFALEAKQLVPAQQIQEHFPVSPEQKGEALSQRNLLAEPSAVTQSSKQNWEHI